MDETRYVTSVDGTALAVRVTGEGPPIVLVHGSGNSKATWALVEPLLCEHHAVWVDDRRGRGQNGDASDYDYRREVEDVLAVVGAAGDGVHLVGHSFGGYCALDAATMLDGLRSLILYEIPVHASLRSAAIKRALGRIASGDREGGLLIFLREVAALSDDEIAARRSQPHIWDQILQIAPTLDREMDALTRRPWEPARYGTIQVPTRYLTGSLTGTPVYLSPAEALQAIPHMTTAVLEGQRHIAMGTDPVGFVERSLQQWWIHGSNQRSPLHGSLLGLDARSARAPLGRA